MGMAIMASVRDTDTVYPLLGKVSDSIEERKLSFPHYVGANFDASATNFTYHIPAPSDDLEPAELTISFLSPITPTSTLRQSIPASYIHFSVEGNFDIDVYMDINGDGLSADANTQIQWYIQSIEFDENGALWSWQIQREEDAIFTENADHAEWGKIHFSAPSVSATQRALQL